MNRRKGVRAGIGVVFCVVGFVLARATPYRETTVVIGAAGCSLMTDVVDQGHDDVRGFVVLLHGLSANKKIMAYLARAFASQNLRVFVPDLPGHGRTPGPFSFERAESCAETLVRELSARRAIDLQRTMLAGHSMGGAIAIRVATRVGVAGVVAVSPAPPRAIFPSEDAPPVPVHTLAVSGGLEPFGIGRYARDLIAGDAAATGKYLFVPQATHVSVLFDTRMAHAAQDWCAETLHFPVELTAPSYASLAGSLAGLGGILLLAGPFVREMVGAQQTAAHEATSPKIQPSRGGKAVGLRGLRPALQDVPFKAAELRLRPFEAQGKPPLQVADEGSIVPGGRAAAPDNASAGLGVVPVWRALFEVAGASFLAVALLRFGNPLSFVRVFNGSYLASFGLITGVVLLLIHHRPVRAQVPTKINALLLALFAGLLLHLLVTGWLDATFSESWLSWARWVRVPVFFAAALPYLLGEELLVGPVGVRSSAARLCLALAQRVIAFVALAFGILVLHSGAILIILLVVYLALFFVFQRLGMDLVRQQTGSAIAAALFGAILLAGFCLVIFPVT